jgi:HEAT repeats
VIFDVILVAAGLLLFGGAKVADDVRRQRAWLRDQRAIWADLARARGLTVSNPPPRFLAAASVVGRRPPIQVTITPYGGVGLTAASVTIDGLPQTLRVAHRSIRTEAARLVAGDGLVLGDPRFDETFVLDGDPLVVRAAFDEETRAVALRLFGSRQSVAGELALGGTGSPTGVSGGTLRVACSDASIPRTPEPEELLRLALALVDRLSGVQVEERLAAIARRDPVNAVRLSALELLRDERPGHPAAREALVAGCADAEPFIRLTAAAALGPRDGRAALQPLASSAAVSDEVSAGAVDALRSALAPDDARAILAESLRHRRTLTAAACVDRLAHEGTAHADVVARVLAGSGGALAVAAARALGRCGTAAQVPALRDAERAASGFAELSDACRGAIAAIQARPGAASPGQLSLAEGGGEVSLADDARGRLGLAERDRRGGSGT